MSAFRPATRLGDQTVSATMSGSQRWEITTPAYRVVRFAPVDDIYVCWGDSSVEASQGSTGNLKIPGGAIECLLSPEGCSYFAVVAATGSTEVNLALGDGE